MKQSLYETNIVELLQKGVSGKAISVQLGCSAATVSRNAKKHGFSKASCTRRTQRDWEDIANYYNDGHTYRECSQKFNINKKFLWKASKQGKLSP